MIGLQRDARPHARRVLGPHIHVDCFSRGVWLPKGVFNPLLHDSTTASTELSPPDNTFGSILAFDARCDDQDDRQQRQGAHAR